MRLCIGWIATIALIAACGFASSAGADEPKLLDGKLQLDRTMLLAQAPVYPPPAYPVTPAAPPYYQPPPVYYQPQPPRPTRVEMRPRYGLIAAGLAVFGAAWIMDITWTYGLAHQPAWESFVPLIGPLLQMNDGISSNPDNTSSPGYHDEGTQIAARVLLVWDFIGQAAGVLMAILGVSLWKPVTVYAEDGTPLPPKARMAIVPGPTGHTLALVF